MLVYTVGLDRLTADAIAADLPQARVEALPPLIAPVVPRRTGPRPDAVVLGHRVHRVELERASVWITWGEQVVVVVIDPHTPFADVWRGPAVHSRVELGPGFLIPFLPTR